MREHIKEANVNVEPYNIFFDSLKNYKFCSSSPSVLVHDLRCSAAVYSTLREHDQVDLIQVKRERGKREEREKKRKERARKERKREKRARKEKK